MLCEVEAAILNLGLEVPEKNILTWDWEEEGDTTVMLVQDWGVLRVYRTILNEWILAFRNATAATVTTEPDVCKPKIKPNQKNQSDPKSEKNHGKANNKLPKKDQPMKKHVNQTIALALHSENHPLRVKQKKGPRRNKSRRKQMTSNLKE